VSMSKKNQPYTSKLRGVSALLGGGEVQLDTLPERQGVSDSQVLSIQSIKLPSHQPRRYFDEEKLQRLTDSVKAHGVLEPLLVRVLESEEYELVAGERRYRAAQAAGLKAVPVMIKRFTDDEAWEIALVENLQREDLNPIEETEGMLSLLSLRLQVEVDEVIQRLHRMQNEAKGKVTQNVLGNQEGDLIQRIFSEVGSISWESFVSSRLPLLKMPQDVLEAVRQGKIAYTKAQAIARVHDEAQRKKLLKQSVNKGLSLSEIKEQVAELKAASRELDGGESEEEMSFVDRFDLVYRQVKKGKLWDDPKKLRKLEKMLADLEGMLDIE
jgi:ParB family transcriptional regulator, chromosome partitioning protein